MRRAARAVLLAGLAAASVGAQCQGNPKVSFEVVLPGAVAAQADWVEIGVLPGACPSPDQLAGGIPASGSVVRVAIQKGNTSPPPIGDLKKGSYAFAAAARAADCSVVGTGCTVVDVGKARDVTIQISGVQQPTGACPPSQSCVDARCVPVVGNGNPNLGAGCSMELVGAGPLGDPLELSGSDVASAPAVVATDEGFLVAYREYDQLQGQAQVTLAAIDAGGGLTLGKPVMLPGQCPNQDESDAVGLGYFGGAGVVASARPACSQPTSGIDTYPVDASGRAMPGGHFNPTTSGQPRLSNAHALVLVGASSGWLAYVDQGGAHLAGLSGLGLQAGTTPFGGAPPLALAQVNATDKMIALLAAGSGVASDAGMPIDAGMSLDAGMPVDAGAGDSTLRLQLGPSPAMLASPYVLTGSWGALDSEGGRAFVLANAPAGEQPLTWSAMDLGSGMPAASGALAPPGKGAVAGGDVVFHGDRVAFAVEQQGSISLVVYDHASTTPTYLRSVLLSDDPRVPSQATVRDGNVAVAASDTRVVVVWTTASTLGPNDAVGGYAVYACAP